MPLVDLEPVVKTSLRPGEMQFVSRPIVNKGIELPGPCIQCGRMSNFAMDGEIRCMNHLPQAPVGWADAGARFMRERNRGTT